MAIYLKKHRDRFDISSVSNINQLSTANKIKGSLITFDGDDLSTSIRDLLGKPWSVIGNAKLSSTSPKYGSASLSLDGAGDGINTPHHSDFDFGSGDFTIDFWLKTTRNSGYPTLLIKRGSGSTWAWNLLHSDGYGLEFWVHSYSASGCILRMSSNYWDGVWHHHAIVRSGSLFSAYFDGSKQIGGSNIYERTWEGTIANLSGSPTIGYDSTTGRSVLGNIDEFRIIKGVALWTENFTPPVSGLTINKCFLHNKRDRLNIKSVSTQNQLI